MNVFNILKLFISTACVVIFNTGQARGVVHIEIPEMDELLKADAHFLTNLESYIASQDVKLNFLKRRAKDFRNEHRLAEVESEYVSNPMDAFLLTKRLTRDWKSIEKVIVADSGSDYLANIASFKPLFKLPTIEDLNEAALTLVRLQDTYNLDTSSMAKGELNGVQYSTEMTSNDCFEIGRQAYKNKDYYYTTLWMHEAMDRLTTETSDSSISKSDILEYLSISSYRQGNFALAVRYINELLEILPDDEKAIRNKIIYEKSLAEEANRKLNIGKKSDDQINPVVKAKTNVTLLYEKLCRNEIRLSPDVLSKLKCKYVTNVSPFLKIAPLKLEEACLQPYIVIYHDVISDAEINVIKEMAKPRFKRATIGNGKNGGVVSNYRISKSAWLQDKEHKIIRDINVRVEDMTGLTVGESDKLQVAYYGIGGHYMPHLDIIRRAEISTLDQLGPGNPIVTVLFYINNVAQGGATVFPELNLAIWPKKGSAAFWYNFHTSGQGDHSTLHAACPVLVGSKWVSNKWLHESNQKILRPYKFWQTTLGC